MGTVASEDFYSGTAAAMAGGTTMIIDFVIPAPKENAARGLPEMARLGGEGGRRLLLPCRGDVVGRQRASRHGRRSTKDHGVNSFKHFMAYKGAIMADDESAGEQLHARARAGRHLHRPCRERRAGVPSAEAAAWPPASPGPKATRCRARRRSRARRPTARSASPQVLGVPLYIVHNSCKESLEAITRARNEGQRVFGEVLAGPSADRRPRLPQSRLGFRGGACDEPAVPRRRSIRRRCGAACSRAICRPRRPITAASARRRRRWGAATSPRSRTAPAASRTAWRCCGITASTPAG